VLEFSCSSPAAGRRRLRAMTGEVSVGGPLEALSLPPTISCLVLGPHSPVDDAIPPGVHRGAPEVPRWAAWREDGNGCVPLASSTPAPFRCSGSAVRQAKRMHI